MTNQGGVNHLPSDNYDKRLFRICQSPQRNFLNENYEPTPETVQRVKNGNLFITFDEEGCITFRKRKVVLVEPKSVPSVQSLRLPSILKYYNL